MSKSLSWHPRKSPFSLNLPQKSKSKQCAMNTVVECSVRRFAAPCACGTYFSIWDSYQVYIQSYFLSKLHNSLGKEKNKNCSWLKEITLDEKPFMFCSLWRLLQKEGHSSSMEKKNSEINNEELEKKYRRSNPLTVRRFHSFKAICLFPGSPLRNSSCLFLFERLFVLLVRSTFFLQNVTISAIQIVAKDTKIL